MSMRDNALTKMKREALYSLYKKGLEEGRFSSVSEAGEWISHQPAPCYYVSPEKAYKCIGWIKARRSLANLNASQRRLARQLYENYKDYLIANPHSKRSCIDIMDELLQQPAPEFYMTPDSIRVTLVKTIAQVRKKHGLK